MKARRLPWVLVVSALVPGCDKSLLHKITAREPATDTTCAPDAPADNLAAQVFADHVTLTWTSEAGNEDGFIIERSGNGVDFAESGRTLANTTSYADAPVALGEVYQYRVESFRVVNGQECATTPTPPVEATMFPAAITGIAFTHLTVSDLVLSFDDPNKRALSYHVERLLSGAPGYVDVALQAPASQPVQDWGLTPHQSFTYRVTVTNVMGDSAPFTASVYTSAPPAPVWSGAPRVEAGCLLRVPGTVAFDSASTPIAAFATATGSVSGCSVTSADATGLSCVLTQPLAATLDTTWSVTDTLGVSGAAPARTLSTSTTTSSIGTATSATSDDPALVGRQGVRETCGACTGGGAGMIVSGAYHSCVLNADASVSCWGRNFSSELGTGDPDYAANPSPACAGDDPPCANPSTDLAHLALNFNHGCGVTATGGVKCWGANDYGQLGDGSLATRGHPVTVCASGTGTACPKLTGVRKVAVGERHSCALIDADGSVDCWGANSYGELGRGLANPPLTPRPAPVCLTGSATLGNCVPLTGAVDIAAGSEGDSYDNAGSTCAVLTDGKVYCWGGNRSGRLGAGVDSSPYEVYAPTQVCDPQSLGCNSPLVGVSQMAVAKSSGSGGHVCVLVASGRVLCWGDNVRGELGDGSTTARQVPFPVCTGTGCTPLDGVSQVVVGTAHTCALRQSDGAVLCWGDNSYGQLGVGDLTVTAAPKPAAVCQSGTGATCVPMLGVAALAAGDNHTCALFTSGTRAGEVHCWGDNQYGQVGLGTNATPWDAVAAPLTVCGPGTTWNGSSCAGGGGALVGVTQLTAAASQSCAVAGGTNRLYCWGYNSASELGLGATASSVALQASPVCASGSGASCPAYEGVAAIAMGGDHSCAILSVVGPHSRVAQCWGANDLAQLGTGNTTAAANPGDVCADLACTAPLDNVDELSLGPLHTCARTTLGLQCFGDNSYGEAGAGSLIGQVPPPFPVIAGLVGLQGVTAGPYFTCAIVSAGGLVCFGENSAPRLGIAPNDAALSPTPVCTSGFGTSCVPLEDANSVTVGQLFGCTLSTTGGVRCWGSDYDGELGDGLGTDRPIAGSDILTGVSQLDAGQTHACAVMTTDGAVECWGSGATGANTTNEVPTPQKVFAASDGSSTLSGATAVSASSSHTCAVLQDHTLRCWGDNSSWALGLGADLIPVDHLCADAEVCATGSVTTPPCAAVNDAVEVAVGDEVTCARASGTSALTCWGRNAYGTLGGGFKPQAPNPASTCAAGYGTHCTSLGGVVSLAAGAANTCAVVGGGELSCWGNNDFNQLGPWGLSSNDNGEAVEPSPIPICTSGAWNGTACMDGSTPSPFTGVLGVAVGGDYVEHNAASGAGTAYSGHICAIVTGGHVKCWGANDYGQIGNGETTPGLSYVYPTDVVCEQTGTPGCAGGLGTPLSNIVGLAAGGYHNCALTNLGDVVCWGHNLDTQLGTGDTVDRSRPAQVLLGAGKPLAGIVAVSAGTFHTCALSNDSTVWCWGADYQGQRGDGTWWGDTTTPTPFASQVCATGTGGSCVPLLNAVALAAGAAHTCALLGDGSVTCWGDDNLGTLGDGTWGDPNAGYAGGSRVNPVAVCGNEASPSCSATHTCATPLTGAVAIAAGSNHTCVLDDDGTVSCWGPDQYDGQRGDGVANDDDLQCTATRACAPGAGRCGGTPAFLEARAGACPVVRLAVAP